MKMDNMNQCPNCHKPYWEDGQSTAKSILCECYQYTTPLHFTASPMTKQKEVKFCQYCGSQRLVRTRQVCFGEPGYIDIYTCQDC